MLRFPANALPLPLEDFLAEVHSHTGEQLRVPIKLELGGGLGGTVQAVQVISTWAKLNSEKRQIRLSRHFADSSDTRDRFASTLPGMATLYFADSVDCEGTQFDRIAALRAVTPRVEAMQDEDYQNTLRGIGIALCCFMGARNEFLKPLYAVPEPKGVHDEVTFRQLVPRLLERLNGGRQLPLTEGQLDYLSAMVYQLFLNCDQHGSEDIVGGRYKSGMRGISARLTALSDVPSVVTYAGEDTHLRSYLTRLLMLPMQGEKPGPRKGRATNSQMHLLEFSVFDTGPGLALRWLSKKTGAKSYADFTEAEELDAVRTCFEKHTTTKASDLFGQGLPVALSALKHLNAFMTLRTGRLSLYQDFSTSKTTIFSPQRRFTGRSLSEISGAAYTIWFRVK
jgi:hypothetical protein